MANGGLACAYDYALVIIYFKTLHTKCITKRTACINKHCTDKKSSGVLMTEINAITSK